MTAQERTDALQDLKDIVAFLEAHPGVPPPRFNSLLVTLNTREEIAAVAKQSSWQKDYNGQWFSLQKRFGTLTLDVYVPRDEVCRKVVTGTRVLPAVEAQPERVEQVEEWVCDEASLLGDTSDELAEAL
jgi:hypothetical protein